MKLPKKPNFKDATIFTQTQKAEAPPAGSPFTEAGIKTTGLNQGKLPLPNSRNVTKVTQTRKDVTDLTGRTIFGERVPEGKDRSVMVDRGLDRKAIEQLNPPSELRQEVKNQDMLRDLPKGDKGWSPTEGIDWQGDRLDGTKVKKC